MDTGLIHIYCGDGKGKTTASLGLTMSIGQGVAVTPLQMVQAFGGLANGGHMMKPFLIKEIDNPDGSIYKKTDPVEVSEPISPEVSRVVSDIMMK